MLWLASHFTEKLEQIRTHIPYFYFAFSVLWSGPVEQLIKSEVLMTTTYHLLQWLSQYTSRVFGKISFSFSAKQKGFNRQNKRNGHKIFMINQILKILLLCTTQDYNQAISHIILSQIFDTVRNAYCILSDQYTDNSSCFLLW